LAALLAAVADLPDQAFDVLITLARPAQSH
jgi:hypothetical protein